MSEEPIGLVDFVRARYSALARTGFLLVGDRGLAEDLVQTALAATFQSWERLASPETAEAYTRTTLVRLAGRARRRRWRGEVPTDWSGLGEAPTSAAVPDMEGALDLRRALSALPWDQRAVLVLRFFDDLSEQETADVLGCSLGTVKSRTSRALVRLRSAMPNELEARHG